MKTLYFDCFAGISGDMTIGALIDLGVDFDYLKAEISKVPVDGFELRWSRTVRANISAGKFDVVIAGAEAHTHTDDHGHTHGQDHGHHHGHGAGHDHAHRKASEILAMLRTSTLGQRERDRAVAIFEKLAVSEGRVHHMPPGDVTFHEVGAIDSIVDVVGAAVGLEAVGAERFVCSPINVGGGFIQCQHGVYPVPAPATSNLLEGAPVYSKHVEAELVTPTGAAILAATVDRFGPLENFRIEKTGYGAGTKDLGPFPNCLRVFLGEEPGGVAEGDRVVLIEANIDDMSPAELAYASDTLMTAGALDVLTLPALMKKGRAGHVLQVIGRPVQEEALVRLIFAETTTIGLRVQQVSRHVLPREVVQVTTGYGKIAVKVARSNGRILNASPEYEDCARVARETGEPFHRIREEAIRCYLENSSSGETDG
jgi:pyridinium-3,5-bisthiocarboxylic acid mononucleotide nickel chelatase